MRFAGRTEKLESYFENYDRQVKKHISRIKDQIGEIDGSSLKLEDKIELKQKLIELIKEATK